MIIRIIIFLFFISLFSEIQIDFLSKSYAYEYNCISQVEQSIYSITNAAISSINTNKSDSEKIVTLTKLFLSNADLEWMGKYAIARIWRSLSDDQKQLYLKAYQNYMIKTYIPKFREYTNKQIIILNTKKLSNDRYLVNANIIPNNIDKNTNKSTLNISYMCKDYGDCQIKIIDISLENISLIASQRSEFGSIIKRGGFEELMKLLSYK